MHAAPQECEKQHPYKTRKGILKCAIQDQKGMKNVRRCSNSI